MKIFVRLIEYVAKHRVPHHLGILASASTSAISEGHPEARIEA